MSETSWRMPSFSYAQTMHGDNRCTHTADDLRHVAWALLTFREGRDLKVGGISLRMGKIYERPKHTDRFLACLRFGPLCKMAIRFAPGRIFSSGVYLAVEHAHRSQLLAMLSE